MGGLYTAVPAKTKTAPAAALTFTNIYRPQVFLPFQGGLAFLSISFGYIVAWAVFIAAIWRNQKERRDRPSDKRSNYESRLWFLLYIVPCLLIGLFSFV
jgi:hypothetical protein